MDGVRIQDDIIKFAARLDARMNSLDEFEQAMKLLDNVDTYLTNEKIGGQDSERVFLVIGTSTVANRNVLSFLFQEEKRVAEKENLHCRAGCTDSCGSLLPVVRRITLKGDPIAVWIVPEYRKSDAVFVKLVKNFAFQRLFKENRLLRFILVGASCRDLAQNYWITDSLRRSLVCYDTAVTIYTSDDREADPESATRRGMVETQRHIRSFALPASDVAKLEGKVCTTKSKILSVLSELPSFEHAGRLKLEPTVDSLLYCLSRACVDFAKEKISSSFRRARKANWVTFRPTYKALSSIDPPLDRNYSLPDLLERLDFVLQPTGGTTLRLDEDVTEATRRVSIVELAEGHVEHRQTEAWLSPDIISSVKATVAEVAKWARAVGEYSHIEKLSSLPSTLVISRFDVCLSKEKEIIEKFVVKHQAAVESVDSLPNVVVVGFATLKIDIAFEMWANIAFVSPSVEVSTEQGFDLTARGQVNGAEERKAEAGCDGAHGTPGTPGGNMVVVCHQLKDKKEKLRCTVSCGQNGRDAQNGGDGVNGVDSKCSESAFVNTINSEIRRGLLSNSGNVPRNLASGLRLLQVEKHYSPFAEDSYGNQAIVTLTIKKEPVPGTPRTPVGSGGQGGAGGRGGKILLVEAGQRLWEGQGWEGQKGRDGKAGRASRDGDFSPSFSASVEQWTTEAGWGRITRAEPWVTVETEPVEAEKQPSLVRAEPVKSGGPEAAENHHLDLPFLKRVYEVAFAHMEAKFPRCDFSDLAINWDVADAPTEGPRQKQNKHS